MKTGTLAGILNRTAACLQIVLIFGVCWLFSFSLYSQNTHPNSIFQVNERTLGNNVSVNINLPVLSHEGQILSGHSVTSNPLKGTLNTTVGNSYIYTPNYFQVGNDSFDWQALDTSTGITATYRCIIQINSLNSPPTDLNSTSPLTIAENQPIGTVVGEFNATDPDLNKRFTQGLGTKIWEFQTGGAIWSKPALASNGLVFFGSKDNKFYALRSETGQKVWEFSGSLPFCKPVVGPDNKVYVGSEDGKVYAFDFLGNKLWEFLTGAKVVASPTLDENGTLYVGSCDNKFYALRCTDGSKLWEFDTGAQIHTKAAISESGILYFGNNGSSAKLYAINSSNGLKVWDFPTGPKIWSSPAIGKNGNIYFGCHDSKVYCLRPTDGTQVWSYSAQSQITSPVTIGYQNTLFVATSSGKLLAINIENGSLKWQFNTASSGIRNVPTIAADNSVYFGDMDGKLYSINGSTGLKNWDLQVGTNFSVSSPCISSSGRIFIGSQDNKFYCVQGSAPLASDAEWPAYGFNNLRTGRWKPHLTYHLVSGPGDGNNSLFTLETNGTLKTATIFDYESNVSTYSIRVHAKDEFNASVEGNFTVSLTDIYEPSQPNHLVDLNSSVNLEMIWVEPGTFTRGQVGVAEPVHDVTLTKGLYLGKYEVTQAQYEAVMMGNTDGLSATPSNWFNNPNRPVEKVSWDDAQKFLIRLNELEQENVSPGWAYILPTEAEWEYACRSGTTTAFSWGSTINSEHANGPSSGYAMTRNVGLYPANPWGFFDMHGNVWEWTADASGSYSAGSQVDPYNQGGADSYRVSRGGSWGFSDELLRSARRAFDLSNHRDGGFGFRLAYKYTNKSPHDLNSTAPLNFAENQPIGTVVGEFNAIDPDVNATLTYSLVSGAGDGNNTLFTLETNGTLRTAVTFDYESNASTYTIRVQAKDEFNASVEGNFTVTLTDDQNEPSFTSHVITSSASRARVVFGYDVNNDGNIDVLSASEDDNTIAWYENNGSQYFFKRVITSSATAVRSLDVVDLDGDGDMDALSAGEPDDTIAWYENDGSHNFTKRIITNSLDVAGYVEAVDLDLDGDVDVLASGNNVVAWYENDGNENFTHHVITTSANAIRSVTSSDLDADGDLDIIYSSQYDSEIIWQENDGSQNFSKHTITSNASNPGLVQTVDFDQDGDLDVLSSGSSQNTIAWYENNGSGSFVMNEIYSADQPGGFYAVDFDQDGDVDVLGTSIGDDRVIFYENIGSQNFIDHEINSVLNNPGSVHAIDLDGDGDLDVLTASYYDNTIAWHQNHSQVNQTPANLNFTIPLNIAENQPIGTVVGDFNATDPDANSTLTYSLVSGAGDGNNSLFTLDTNGTLKTATTFDYETNASTYAIRVQAKDEYNATVEGNFTVSLTDDQNEDTDGDGFTDAQEISAGTNQNDPNSKPGLNFGLVAWYPFDGNASDMSGNGKHGTVNGATLGTDRHGQVNKAYSFDGVDDWIEVNHHPSIDFNNADSFTLSLWLKFGVGNTNYRSIIEKWSGSGAYSYVLRHSDASHIYFNRNDGSSSDRLDILEDKFPQTFQHVLVTSNGSILSLFLNLVQKQSVSISTGSTSNTSNLFFGKRGGSSVYNFSGWMDEIRLYDRALSVSEVSALYQIESALPAQSVTFEKLSPALSDLIDGNGSLEVALPAGLVIARKPGEASPPGYTLFQRNEYNASLVWEEMAPVSVARRVFDGAVVFNSKIYVAGGYNSTEGFNIFETYDPSSNEWQTLPSFSESRVGLACAVLEGKIFVISGHGRSSVEIYDPAANEWSFGPSLPEPIRYAEAITIDGRLFLMGGMNESDQNTNQVLELEKSTNQWITKAPMLRYSRGHRLVEVDGKIWAVGGYDSVDSVGSHSNKVEIYDPVNNSWEEGIPLNTARHFPNVWVSHGKVFAGGGFGGTFLNSLEVYDPNSSQWILIGSLPESKIRAATVVNNNKVYIIAGEIDSAVYSNKVYAADLPAPTMNLYFKDGNASAEAELSTLGMADGSVTLGQLAPDALAKIGLDHNPATVEGSLLAIPRGQQPPSGYALYKRSDRNGSLVWDEKAPVSVARSTYDGAVGLNGKIYLMGGISSDNNATHSYDPSTNTWSRQSNMINPHAAGAFATAGGKVFAIGGTSNPTSFEIYDPASDQWTAGPAVPQPLKYCSAISLDGVVYVVGCKISDTNSNRIFAYDSISQTWSEKSNMPTARHAASLVVLDGKIWAMGGWTGQPSNVPTNKVEVYDPISNTWSNGPALDIAKAWTSAWVVDGKIYVAGGNDNQGGNYRSEVLRLDTGTNQWVQVSTLPEPKAYAGYAQVEGMIFQISGSTANGVHSNKVFAADITPPMDLYYREVNASGPIELSNLNADLTVKMNAAQSVTLPKGLVSAFKPGVQAPSDYGILERTDQNATHQWKEMAPVSVARNIHDGSAVLNGKIYVAGGWTNTPRSEVERYDPSTNQWESLQSLSTPRNGPSLVALNGKLFCIGGSTTSSVDLATVEVYDPSSNQWSSGVSLPIPLTHLSAVVVGGKILVAGGQNSGGSSNQVFEFDPFTNQWTQKSSMLSARNGLRMVVEAGKVYALGGNIPKAERYDPVSDTWTSLPDMLVRRAYPFVWSNKGSIYAASGNSGQFESSIEVFDPVSQTWRFKGNVPSPRHGSGSVVLGEKVYMIAGDLGSSFYTNQVYAADLLLQQDLYFRSVARVSNNNPINLIPLAPLTIAENLPIGSIVGDLNATDPDTNSTLTYHLVSGAGDGNNSLFSLESNGTLKTATTFDYETNASTYSIRVQAKDEFNATVEGNFTVVVINLNEPTIGSVTVSGTSVVGQTLNASNSLTDGDGMGVVSYQWYRDGVPIVLGGTFQDGNGSVDGLGKATQVLCSADNKHVYVLGFGDDSVSHYERNATTGELSFKSLLKDGVNGVNGLDGPRNMVLSGDGEFAFVAGGEGDSISWFDRNTSTGTLSYLGILEDGVGGVDGLNGPHNIGLSNDSRHAYVTGWNDNAVSWYEVNSTSGALTFLGSLKDGVNGLDGLSSAYDVALSPNDQHVYLTSAGDDSVSWYDRDTITGDLTFVGILKDQASGVDGLDGARSIALTSDGKFAYLAAATDSSLGWFERNASNGALTFVGVLKNGVNGVDGLQTASHFILSHDEKQLYIVGWGGNAVSWYDRNATSGGLDFGGMLKDGLDGVDGLATPSSISLSADGRSVYVTSWGEDALSKFTRESQSGLLTYGFAKDANYTLLHADLGSAITVMASYTDDGGFDQNVSSGGTAAIQPIYTTSQPNHFVELNSTVDLEMIWVEPGTFTMGQNTDEYRSYKPAHEVTLTKGFYLGKYEVTQAQYEVVMTGNLVTDSNGDVISSTPSLNAGNPNCPVEQVSWNDIQVFIGRLNEHEVANLPNGWSYALPTEAQWEYACRAGTTSSYSFGDDINTSLANYYGFIEGGTASVGDYPPNPWGFFDMHGNVFEWVKDVFLPYVSEPRVDPINENASILYRVQRGGTFYNSKHKLPSYWRDYSSSSKRDEGLGFRLAFRQITEPPTDLNYTAELTISENQPIGTIVGEFNATDPEGGLITYLFAPPTFEGFSPLLWLDANDRSTIIGVSQISQWRDKSGNNFHANQSNVDAMPSLIEKNGISLIGFDGISDILEVGTILSVESSFDVFLVAQQESDLEDYPRMLSSSVTWENDWVAPNWYLGDFLSGGSSPRFTLKAFNRKFSAHKIENLGIAGRTSVNPNKFNGEIGEFIVLQNLSDFQRQKVHGYLAHKWGFVDKLPTGNPYKFDLFSLETNGTLRTSTIFDFETNASTYSIRVQAKDEHNATVEGNFTVTLTDVFENQAPSQISLSPDRVEENMPIGTMVGQLRTIDYDDPNGTGVYQYSFHTNTTGAEFFSLDSNGTMLTKQELDFESNSSHTIALRVTDSLGAHLDQNLTIQVVDTFIPIVETGDPVDVGFQEAILPGKLLDKGSSMDLIQIGMLVSTDPNPYLDTNGVILERGFLDTNQTFEVMMMGLEKGTKYFYRTYAMNAEGIGYGVVKDFVTQVHARGPTWAKAQPGAAADWWTSPWFGSFYMNDTNGSWIMHSKLGWLYPMASGKNGVWLWKEQLGWLWTDEEFYPFLYQNSSAGWLYFYGASKDRLLFYHYRDERWLEMNKGGNNPND